jgi:hypothetical protein
VSSQAFDDDVSPSMSDLFTRKEKTTYGDLWFWQGARLEYVVRKDAIRYLPSGSSSAQNEFFKSLPDGMTPADMGGPRSVIGRRKYP